MTLAHARLYLVAPARLATGDLAAAIPDLAAAGVDVVQLREKDRSPGDIQALAEPVLDACRETGIPFIVNDYPEVAAAVGADGVHVGQDDVAVPDARRVTGGIVGLSTHTRDQITAAMEVAPDYIAVGPVFATPTKPGRSSVGLDLVSFAAGAVEIPWFAIGGIDEETIEDVVAAGARRVVVVRAITHAPDPPAAAARLAAALPG
ncbi:MAG TPA: thiamine phosphate synthase [Actinomycetota bacterium]|nr:thiamine phosphate synthase [Actinomycetota bacterium]